MINSNCYYFFQKEAKILTSNQPAEKPGLLLQQEFNSESCGSRLDIILFVQYQMEFKL